MSLQQCLAPSGLGAVEARRQFEPGEVDQVDLIDWLN